MLPVMSSMPAPPATRVVVALDGPASSGKSSVGSAAAARLGLRFVDTGLLYRALTALALREGVATDDVAGLVGLVDRVTLGDDGSGRLARVLLDGDDATGTVHTQEVDAAVSAVARVPEVRAALLDRQRALTAGGGIILAGRDIGTVVLPDAPLKLYLDASVEERARAGSRSAAWTPRVTRRTSCASSCGPGTRRTADARWRRSARPDDAVVISTDGLGFEQTVDLVAATIARAETAASAPVAARAPAPVPAIKREKPEPAAPARRNRVLETAMRLDNDQTLLVRMTALVARIFSRAFARIRFEGLDRIPRTGPVILAANHISNFDAVVTGAWITPALRRRRIHWLGKRELFDWPVLGWIAAHGGVHPVDRGTADVEAFRLAMRILEAGYVLLVFPEGTRSPTGELQEAKDGLATLAMRTGAVIVPIGVNNSDAVWAKGRKLPSPFPRRTISVRIGEPFSASDLVPPGTERRAAKAVATAAIMARIAALLEPRHRGAYASTIHEDATPEP